MNYLLLRGLKLFYSGNSDAMKIYEKLKSNLMDDVCFNYYFKGFFYENFDCWNGIGSVI